MVISHQIFTSNRNTYNHTTNIMLIMSKKYNIKSCKYTKNMFKAESYTENKPKIYQNYTKFWIRVKEAIASMYRDVVSLTKG